MTPRRLREDMRWATATAIAVALCIPFLPVALLFRLVSRLTGKHHKP